MRLKGFPSSIILAIAVLIIACISAFTLLTPTSVTDMGKEVDFVESAGDGLTETGEKVRDEIIPENTSILKTKNVTVDIYDFDSSAIIMSSSVIIVFEYDAANGSVAQLHSAVFDKAWMLHDINTYKGVKNPRIAGYSVDANGIVFDVAVDAMPAHSDTWIDLIEMFGKTSVIPIDSDN